MAIPESLAYLYGLQRFGIKLGLDNIRTLLERLGNPHDGLRYIHVAGTNGKGSVSATLASCLQAAGQRTGLYTSPHLQHFNERIRVDGQLIPAAEIERLVVRLRAVAGDLPVTFFEFTTAMALVWFREQQVDWVVLEVGMGGRLDATNVVRPELAVITPISFDHCEQLGHDLAAIAAEKAGIIKPGITVISALQPPEAEQVLARRCRELGASLAVAGRELAVANSPAGVALHGRYLDIPPLAPVLPGAHQRENLALALTVLDELAGRGLGLTPQTVRAGVAAVAWPGRCEWWPGEQRLLLDGAHNPAGCAVLADYLDTLLVTGIHLVFGTKRDKQGAAMLRLLLPRAIRLYAVAPPVELAADPAALLPLAAAAGVPAQAFPEIEAALAAARLAARPEEIIVVSGSLFLVAAARDVLVRMEAA